MSEEKSELCLLDEAYIEEQKGLISDLECDVHFWKTKAEKAQAKLDAVEEYYRILEDKRRALRLWIRSIATGEK
jgi:hypothetical protein